MNFLKINKDKQDEIINVCLKLFAKNGYKNTSTEMIAKEAGISKALVFHYFNSKKILYLYLYNYSIQFIVDNLKQNKLDKTTDFFDYIINASELKWKLMEKYPYIYEFLIASLKESELKIKKEVNDIMAYNTKTSWDQISANVNKKKFKNSNDIPKLIQYISYFADGFIKRMLEEEDFNIKDKREEFVDMLVMLKNNFYKGEYI